VEIIKAIPETIIAVAWYCSCTTRRDSYSVQFCSSAEFKACSIILLPWIWKKSYACCLQGL